MCPGGGSVLAPSARGDLFENNTFAKVLKVLSMLRRQGTPMRAHKRPPDHSWTSSEKEGSEVSVQRLATWPGAARREKGESRGASKSAFSRRSRIVHTCFSDFRISDPCILEPLFFSAQQGSQSPGFVLRPLSPYVIASWGVA